MDIALSEILQDLNPAWDVIRAPLPVAPIRRDLQPLLLERLRDVSDRRALVVSGPRQIGKTEILRQLAFDLDRLGWPPANVVFFDFSDDRLTTAVSMREVVEAAPVAEASHAQVFLFDEVDRAQAWGRFVKGAVDRRQARFVLTSSAAAKLRQTGDESGLGRWDEFDVEPLSFSEFVRIASRQDDPRAGLEREPGAVESYLAVGGFPEHIGWSAREARARLRQEVADRAVRRDLTLAGVDVDRVARLLAYLLQESGGDLVVEHVRRVLETDRRSVSRWVDLLLSTGLVRRLPRWSRRPQARLRGRARIHAADPGLVAAFALGPLPHRDPNVRGKLVEAAVYRHLRTLPDAELGYDPEAGTADFVVQCALAGEVRRVVVEVTASTSVRTAKRAQIAGTMQRVKADAGVLVYGGTLRARVGELAALPLHEMLLDPLAALTEVVDAR